MSGDEYPRKNSTKRSGSRGTTKNEDRLEAFSRGSTKGSADWGGCDPIWIQTVVERITAMGGAVTFGLSRDNGAHSLTLMLDGSRKTMWYNGDEDLNVALETVAATLKQMA